MYELRQTKEFMDWLEDSRGELRKRVLVRLGRAALGNLGDHKMLGSIGEMRLDFGPGYRLYFTVRERVILVMLCGGDKSSQSRDIAKARAMAEDI